MKPAYIILAIVVSVVGYTPAAHAQFLKNLVNNVKQNIGNKAAGNAAGNTTGTTRKDSAGNTGPDSAAFARMMAGFNKPAPMTAADSAAVKGFMTASGGSGMLYQYQLKYDIKSKNKDSVIVDTTTQIISDSHNTHVDMNMLGMRMTMLGHDDQHKYSMVLYPESKMYKLNSIDTAKLNADQKKLTCTVIRIGNETVAGYSCVHSKLTMVTPNGNKPITITEDLWTSTSVPGYAQLKQLTNTQNITIAMLQALDNAGCGGFPVKMTMQSEAIGMDMILITASRKTFPASTFEIPAGYTPMTGIGVMNGLMNGMAPKQKQ
jgi:Domain of unknown function (DUF4412)